MAKAGEKKQKKTATSKTAPTDKSDARLRQGTKKQLRVHSKKEAQNRARLPGSFTLIGRSFVVIKRFWKPLLGIVLVYSILNLIFVSDVIENIANAVKDIDNKKSFSDALGGFSSIYSRSNGASTSAVQSILLILESLVIIWALRHLFASEKVSVKSAYYKAMTPFVPFFLIILVILIQLLPITLGAGALSLIFSTLFIGSGLISALLILVFTLLAGWSLYMISSSLFALYIVTLSDMEPMRALRSAKNLVRFRRWSVARKILFLPIFVLLLIAVIIIPLIMYASFLVTPVFFALTMLSILFVHTYLYNLYRGLLG